MADFGDPSTWEMNVDQFIDSGLPKEKPQELLDLQEQNRKQRLLQALQKIGGGLEDSSLDFIRRKNFGEGKRANQYSKMRTLEELQEIIDNAPQMPAGDKFLDMNPKDLTGESVNAIKYNRNPNYPGRKKGIEYITRKEMDKFGKKGSNELVFKKQGKQKIKDINKFNYFENLKGLQPGGLNYKGDSSKNLIHPYPKVIETTTGTTGEGNARINRSLSGYDKEARPIAVKQVELIKNKENMSPDDFNKERMKLNAQAKQVRENIVSKKGNIAKNYTGYYRVNEQGIFEPKGFNAKKSFAGIGGENIKFNDMTKDQLIKFKEQYLNQAKKKKIANGLSKILKCKLEKGVNCDDPMSYYKSLKEQEQIAAKGKGPNKIKAINKVKAAKNFIYGTLGPYALALEAAIAAPIAGYQASKGSLPSEILNTATYGFAGKDRDELIQEQSGEEIFKARDFLETGEKLEALRKDPIYGGYRGKADRTVAIEDTSKKFKDQYEDPYFADPMTGQPSTEIFSKRQQQQTDAEAKDQKGRDQRAKEFADKYTDTSSGLELFASGGLAKKRGA